ncbi:hypothetical protein DFP72DRAFT_849351 [Ephemerocybe angulata]|uniref:Uncharacterized protein n=1 Tax=Ephemerocybe angulata TaxID=980116 RepID=A0A8H6HWX9_9AGAR|nr:hypothetical protein DFP72DRAFT_849351 [Tulosesus angulatus]
MPSSRVESPFESFLLRGSTILLEYFMGWLEEASVVKIGQLNVRIRYLYDTYSRATWDIHAFLERYVDRPYPLLCALHPDSALIYGEAVLGFFMRGSTPSPDLDICTTLPRFSRICEILETNGYRLSKAMAQYRSSEFSIQSELENIVERSLTTSPKRWSLAGDLSSEPNQHIGFKFPFRKTCSGARRKRINLHLISRIHMPHQLRYGGLPFANSAVTHGESYALPNYLILNKDRPRTTTGTVKVTGSNLSREISILHGPPYGFKRSPYPELGHRSHDTSPSSQWTAFRGCRLVDVQGHCGILHANRRAVRIELEIRPCYSSGRPEN